MLKKNTQEGYALLSVLLVIVIFMVIVLTFMGRAFSTVKQNQLVDKSSKSVALAEMGMTYYQVAVQNIYAANLAAINTDVLQKIKTDSPKKTNEEYVKYAVMQMKTAIKNGLANEQSTISVDGNSFSINSVDYNQESKIILKVQGEDSGKTTILSSEMVFSPTINGLTGTGTGYIAPNFYSIPEPTPSNSGYCGDPSSIGSCKSILVTTTPKTFADKLNNTSTVTIYSKGSNALTLNPSSNANNMSFVNIHTNGDLIISGNVQNASNVTMEVVKNLTIDGQFKLLSGTTVLVNGNVSITKQLWLNSGSKMCVNGTIDTSKIHYNGGELIIKSNVTDSSVWASKCGTSQTPTVEWGDKVDNNVDYEY